MGRLRRAEQGQPHGGGGELNRDAPGKTMRLPRGGGGGREERGGGGGKGTEGRSGGRRRRVVAIARKRSDVRRWLGLGGKRRVGEEWGRLGFVCWAVYQHGPKMAAHHIYFPYYFFLYLICNWSGVTHEINKKWVVNIGINI